MDGMGAPVDQNLGLRQAVCLGHGGNHSFKCLTRGPISCMKMDKKPWIPLGMPHFRLALRVCNNPNGGSATAYTDFYAIGWISCNFQRYISIPQMKTARPGCLQLQINKCLVDFQNFHENLGKVQKIFTEINSALNIYSPYSGWTFVVWIVKLKL